MAYLGETTIDNEVGSIDKAALVASQEDHTPGQFNSLTKTTGREMDLTTMAFGSIISEPILQQRSATEQSAFVVDIGLVDVHTSKVPGK